MRFLFNIWITLFIFTLAACQTSLVVNSGIQPGFEAVNPASIIAVPSFMIPDPSSELSAIDLSILPTTNIVSVIEDKIVESFNHQPNINGYPFSVVRRAIGVQQFSNKGNLKPNILDNLNKSMNDVANRFSSQEVKTRLLITPSCLARRNFIEFYAYCLSNDPQWLSALNSLSARVLNADSALIPVITDLSTKLNNDEYQISEGLAVLLVDTNNGKLIWGNYKKETLINSGDKKYFPDWNVLQNKILTPDFWKSFPGKIGDNELLSISPAN